MTYSSILLFYCFLFITLALVTSKQQHDTNSVHVHLDDLANFTTVTFNLTTLYLNESSVHFKMTRPRTGAVNNKSVFVKFLAESSQLWWKTYSAEPEEDTMNCALIKTRIAVPPLPQRPVDYISFPNSSSSELNLYAACDVYLEIKPNYVSGNDTAECTFKFFVFPNKCTDSPSSCAARDAAFKQNCTTELEYNQRMNDSSLLKVSNGWITAMLFAITLLL